MLASLLDAGERLVVREQTHKQNATMCCGALNDGLIPRYLLNEQRGIEVRGNILEE